MSSIRDSDYAGVPLADLKKRRLSLSPWLHTLIVKDEADKLESALEEMSPRTREDFLTGRQESELSGLYRRQVDSWVCLEAENDDGYVIDVSIHRDWTCHCQLYKPWVLAVAYGSLKVLQCMLRHGVDVLQKDHGGYNVFHALVLVSHLQPRGETKADQTLRFLKSNLPVETLKGLLMDEDDKGLRPLEMASHLGTYLLFSTMFETRGIYLARETTIGLYTTEWFDVTEYECSGDEGRQMKSPMLTFVLLDKSRILCPNIKDILLKSPTGVVLRKWFHAKMQVNRPFIFCWFLIRFLYLVIFFSAMTLGESLLNQRENNATDTEPVERNITNITLAIFPKSTKHPVGLVTGSSNTLPSVTYAVFAYLMLHSSLSCILDMIELYKFRSGLLAWLLHTPLGRKHLAVHYMSYRFAQCLLTISVITAILLIISLKSKFFNIPRFVDHVFLIQAMCCIVISVMFFLQTTSCMGPFIISFERMVKHLACFTAVFFFFNIPYSFVFRHIICDEGSNDLCEKHFSTVIDSIYTVFTITLNMLNFGHFDTKYKVELFLMHVQYVFVIIMLLLNFLVAHFTRSVSNVMDNLHVLMPMQRMSIGWSMELRLAGFLPNLYRRLRHRYFASVGQRLYLTRTRVALSESDVVEDPWGLQVSPTKHDGNGDRVPEVHSGEFKDRPVVPFSF